LTLEELLREIDVGVEDIEGVVRGSAAAAWCLHGTGRRETAGCDDANAGFVVHHFHEECTRRITYSIGKLGYIRKAQEISKEYYSLKRYLLLPMVDLHLVVLGWHHIHILQR